MQRKYSNTTEETTTNFFYGVEVEHTPAFGMETLFVTGIQSIDKILSQAELLNNGDCQIKHIYCGANQSFRPGDSEEIDVWGKMVLALLREGFWVTLDFDSSFTEEIHESGLCEQRKFIPMVSVKIAYTSLFNYNTVIKIDDKGFEATNPGVWCWRLHNLLDTNKFTSWDAYKSDKVIK